jgi:hypothetical protein
MKPQTENHTKKLDLDAGQTRMFQCYFALRPYSQDHLSPEDEAKLEITVVPLDLRSGDVPDNGPRFIEPVPSAEMKSYVERTKPWKKYALKPTADEDKPENMKGECWADDTIFHEGRFMFSALRTFASGGSLYYFNEDWERVCG